MLIFMPITSFLVVFDLKMILFVF